MINETNRDIHNKVKVLYIAGEGRSGSTLIGNILGEIQGFLFVGELLNIWKHFFIENKSCSCGLLPYECEVWKPVIQEAFGSVSKDLAYSMDEHRKYCNRNRHILHFIFPSLRKRLVEERIEYLKNLETLYDSIYKLDGIEIIVDGSKKPTYGKLLEQINSIDLYILHLIRDPRAVAFSWLRKRIQTDGRNHITYMQQMQPMISAYRWIVHNITSSYFWTKQTDKYIILRYEDFINNPRLEIERILGFLGVSNRTLPFIDDRSVLLSRNHVVWGNPNRHRTGVINIVADDEWKDAFRGKNKFIIDLLTFPGRLKYGYCNNTNYD